MVAGLVPWSGGNGSEYSSIMPTLEACNVKDKLVILQSYTGLSNGKFARIPSLMSAGLFMKSTHPPAPPFSDPSPFPKEEGNEPGSRTPSPETYSLPRKLSAIDPSLVSADALRLCVTLKDWHSLCSSVGFGF